MHLIQKVWLFGRGGTKNASFFRPKKQALVKKNASKPKPKYDPVPVNFKINIR